MEKKHWSNFQGVTSHFPQKQTSYLRLMIIAHSLRYTGARWVCTLYLLGVCQKHNPHAEAQTV